MTSLRSDIAAEILGRPRAVIGTGTQGSPGLRSCWPPKAGKYGFTRAQQKDERKRGSFVEENLAEIAERIGGTPGHIVLCDSMEAAVANVGLAIEAVPEQARIEAGRFSERSIGYPLPDAVAGKQLVILIPPARS